MGRRLPTSNVWVGKETGRSAMGRHMATLGRQILPIPVVT